MSVLFNEMDFKALMDEIGQSIKGKLAKKLGIEAHMVDYNENADRITKHVSNLSNIYSDVNIIMKNNMDLINTLKSSGYNQSVLAKILDNFDKAQYELIGRETAITIKIDKYGNKSSINATSDNTSHSIKDVKLVGNANAFNFVYNGLNQLATKKTNSIEYKNAAGLVSTKNEFQIAWKNIFDNRSSTDDLYDTFRVLITLICYGYASLKPVLTSYDKADMVITRLTNISQIMPIVPSRYKNDFTNTDMIISILDKNQEFDAAEIKNTLVSCFNGAFNPIAGFTWGTTTESNTKVLMWMISIVYNIIGSTRINSILPYVK